MHKNGQKKLTNVCIVQHPIIPTPPFINIRKFVKKLYANIFSMKFIKFIVNNNIDIYQIKFTIKIQKTLNNEFNENTISFEDNQKKILEKLTSKKIIPIFKLNTEQNKKYLIDIKILI